MLRVLIALTVIAAGIGAFIYFVERRNLTSRDAEGRKGLLVERLSESRTTRLELTHGNQKIVLQRPADAAPSDDSQAPADNWEMQSPLQVHADANAVQSLLLNVLSAFPERWLNAVGEKDEQAFGFATPEATLQATVAGQTIKIELGGPAPYPKTYYARVVGERRIAVVDEAFRAAMLSDALDLRDRVLLLDQMDAWSAWIWILGDQSVGMHRVKDKWTFDGADGVSDTIQPNPERVEDLGWALRTLKATKFLSTSPSSHNPTRESFEIRFAHGAPIRIEVLGACPDIVDDLLVTVSSFGPLCIDKSQLIPLRRSPSDLSSSEISPAQ